MQDTDIVTQLNAKLVDGRRITFENGQNGITPAILNHSLGTAERRCVTENRAHVES